VGCAAFRVIRWLSPPRLACPGESECGILVHGVNGWQTGTIQHMPVVLPQRQCISSLVSPPGFILHVVSKTSAG